MYGIADCRHFHGNVITFGASLAVLLYGFFCVGECSTSIAAADASAIAAAMESINADDAQNFVNVLADDAMEGRETGSRGGRAAGTYLTQEFQKLHLTPAGIGGGYFQPFGANSRNLLGMIEGSDPQLKKQFVLVTAHYDHVGRGKPSNSRGGIGQIHNGADDNASGDSSILETATAFSHLSEPPKRSVIFALWDGEEAGLLGSKYWIEHPTVPLADVAAVVNVDMIGRLRNNRVIVYGGRTSYGWRQLISRDNESIGLLLDFDWLMKADSDHHPFYSASVPVVMFHTGLHDDYHRPSDKADKINSDGLKSVSQLMFRTVDELADEDARPRFRAASRSESPASQPDLEQAAPPLAGRLGLGWDVDQAKNGIVQVASVTPGSAAAKAGIKTGDRILSYAARPITDAEQLRQLVMATKGAMPIEIERKGSDKPLTLTVQPSGEPITLGITWRIDDAEPGAVFLVRVVPASTADRAGLRVFDRIYEVSGQKFKTSEEFRQLVNSLASPIELLVETRGKVRRVEVDRQEIITAPEENKPAAAATAQR